MRKLNREKKKKTNPKNPSKNVYAGCMGFLLLL